MVRPSVYGQLIIFLVFVPLLTFQGGGQDLFPMAITLMIALACAFVLSITFVPAMTAILISGRVSESEVRPAMVQGALCAGSGPRGVGARALHSGRAGVLAAAMLGFGLLGQEFMPQLDEKDITVTNFRVPSVSIDQSTQMQMRIENALKSLPEVALVFSKNGNADLAPTPCRPMPRTPMSSRNRRRSGLPK
jgi:cobalt-zinc-cadmium resistance protein CzcA